MLIVGFAFLPQISHGALVPQVKVPFVNEVEALDADGFWLVAASGPYYYAHAERRAHPLEPTAAGNTADDFYCLEPSPVTGKMLAGSPDGLFEVDTTHYRPSSLAPRSNGTPLGVTELLLDEQKQLWIATDGRGLYRIPPNADQAPTDPDPEFPKNITLLDQPTSSDQTMEVWVGDTNKTCVFRSGTWAACFEEVKGAIRVFPKEANAVLVLTRRGDVYRVSATEEPRHLKSGVLALDTWEGDVWLSREKELYYDGSNPGFKDPELEGHARRIPGGALMVERLESGLWVSLNDREVFFLPDGVRSNRLRRAALASKQDVAFRRARDTPAGTLFWGLSGVYQHFEVTTLETNHSRRLGIDFVGGDEITVDRLTYRSPDLGLEHDASLGADVIVDTNMGKLKKRREEGDYQSLEAQRGMGLLPDRHVNVRDEYGNETTESYRRVLFVSPLLAVILKSAVLVALGGILMIILISLLRVAALPVIWLVFWLLPAMQLFVFFFLRRSRQIQLVGGFLSPSASWGWLRKRYIDVYRKLLGGKAVRRSLSRLMSRFKKEPLNGESNPQEELIGELIQSLSPQPVRFFNFPCTRQEDPLVIIDAFERYPDIHRPEVLEGKLPVGVPLGTSDLLAEQLLAIITRRLKQRTPLADEEFLDELVYHAPLCVLFVRDVPEKDDDELTKQLKLLDVLMGSNNHFFVVRRPSDE